MDYRTFSIELETRAAEGDRIPATLSTETPVDRFEYREILVHEDGAVAWPRAAASFRA